MARLLQRLEASPLPSPPLTPRAPSLRSAPTCWLRLSISRLDRYLKTLDLSDWNAYGYPITPILKRYKADANAIPSWLSELTSGNAAYGSLTFAPNKFFSSLDLYANFCAWAKVFAPCNKDPFRAFTNKLAEFSRTHPDVIVGANPGGKAKGYRLKRAWRLD